MNPDGTGQHQVSSELNPVVEYAAAPDGTSVVVADGRRLVFLRPDGSERRELTDASHVEFDPAYAPDSDRIAFARADAETGAALGLWTWEIGAGSATEISLPTPTPSGFSPSPDASSGEAFRGMRAPRYAPDGTALAFVDLRGAVGILELADDRLTLVAADVAAPPLWDASSRAVLVRLGPDGDPTTELAVPVLPLLPDGATEVGVIVRGDETLEDAGLGGGVTALTAASDGRIGWIDAGGAVRIATELFEAGETPAALEGVRVAEVVLGPTGGVLLTVSDRGDIVRVELDTEGRTRLTDEGRQVRWLP
jgi:hypothetical protein